MRENARLRRSGSNSVPSAAQGRPRPLEKRTLVFANSTDAAEAVSKLLTSQGLSPLKYHSGQSATDKAAAIRRFSEQGGVLVCTDAAARGLDVPDVGHVIQVGARGMFCSGQRRVHAQESGCERLRMHVQVASP